MESGALLVELVTQSPGKTEGHLLSPIPVIVHADGLDLGRFEPHVRGGVAVVQRAGRTP